MKEKTEEIKKVLILENIRSVHNVGAIFRTSDAIGIDKIFLVGYTPCPIDRFGRKRSDLHKAALGAEESLVWEKINNTDELLKTLKKKGFKIISLEQGQRSIDYKDIKIKDEEKVAIVIGNEVDGVLEETLDSSDIIAEIPMLGNKESLNVSVAVGIFLFRLFDY